MSGLERTAIPRNVLDRLLDVERRLDDLEGFAALPVVDPESGEGDVTYVSIVQEVEIAAGADIDLSGDSPNYTIARAGNVILLKKASGAVMAEFDFDAAGLTAALAAMVDGDVCELPVGTITGGPWTVAAGTVLGVSRKGSVLDGQVTLSDATALETLTVERDEDDAGVIKGVVGPGSGSARVFDCDLSVKNATGNGYAVYADGGTVTLKESHITAETAGVDANPFGGASGYYKGDLIDTFAVEAYEDGYTSGSVNTGVGDLYIVEVSGVYDYDHDGNPDTHQRDGIYQTADGWDTNAASGLGNLIQFSDATRPDADDTGFNSAHVYNWTRTGDGSPVSLRVYDDYYPDNSGSVTVRVYEAVESGDIRIYACTLADSAYADTVLSLAGDRAAYDTAGHPDRHARDIDQATPVYHNPANATPGQVPTWDGEKWVAEDASGVLLSDIETEHRFIINAHRGNINPTDGYPENTLIACLSAAQVGCQRVEVDLRLSSEGTWYLMHDATVDRTTNGSGSISGKTDAQIDALTIDGGYGYAAGRHAGLYSPPTLASVLDALDPYDVTLQLDNKVAASAGLLASWVVEQGWTQRVAINAYTEAEAQAIKAVSGRLAVVGTVGWDETDISTPGVSYSSAQVEAAAPVQIHLVSDLSSDYGASDEAQRVVDTYDKGARGYTTWDLPSALDAWRRTLYLALHDHSDNDHGGQLDWDKAWSDAVHDHSVDGEGGQFLLTSLLSTGASDGQVATADGAGGIAFEDAPSGAGSAWSVLTDGASSIIFAGGDVVMVETLR